MQVLNFENGVKRYAVNGDETCVITVNPADVGLPSRYAEKMPEVKALAAEMKNAEPTPERIADYDRRLRGLLNGIFGSDVCTPAFGSANCFSPVGDGKLLFEAFLEAFIPVIEQEIGERLEASKKRTEKYITAVTEQ